MAQEWTSDCYSSTGNVATQMGQIENNFLALKSSFSGSDDPYTLGFAVAGTVWLDTGNHILKVRNEANNAWQSVWDMANNKPIVTNNVSADFGSALKDPAVGTAGLRTLGTGSAQALPGNTNYQNHLGYQVFTSDGTWSKPSGVTAALVICIGGGGGGGAHHPDGGPAYDGDDGKVNVALVDVSGSSSYAIDVGAYGAGGSFAVYPAVANGGNAGSSTTFGSTIVVGGGGNGGTGSLGAGGTGTSNSWGTGATNPYFKFSVTTKGNGGAAGNVSAGSNGVAGVCVVIWVET